jgi:hypothetical protein
MEERSLYVMDSLRRLKSRDSRLLHLDKAARQLMPKLDCGATLSVLVVYSASHGVAVVDAWQLQFLQVAETGATRTEGDGTHKSVKPPLHRPSTLAVVLLLP